MLSPIAPSQQDSWRYGRGRPSSSTTAATRPASDAAPASRDTFVTSSDFQARTTAAAVPPDDPTSLRRSGCSARFGGGFPASVLARASWRELKWDRGCDDGSKTAWLERGDATPALRCGRRRLSGVKVLPEHHPSRFDVKRVDSPCPWRFAAHWILGSLRFPLKVRRSAAGPSALDRASGGGDERRFGARAADTGRGAYAARTWRDPAAV
jgi:hypothetical protein